MSRYEAAQSVAAMVQSAKTILAQAQKLSDEHGLAFDYSLTENSRVRESNGWDDSGCTIDYDGWDSSYC